MPSIKPDTYSFIIKLWMEEASGMPRSSLWRGHITHVPSGERRYLKSLGDITRFIEAYMEEMGADASQGERVCRWLQKFWCRK